jgi:hypothetical protein
MRTQTWENDKKISNVGFESGGTCFLLKILPILW